MSYAIGSAGGLTLSRLSLPPRYRILIWAAGCFVAINAVVRLALLVFEADAANLAPWRLAGLLTVGLLYDLAAAAYLLVPFALLALLLPDKTWGRKAHAIVACVMVVLGLFAMLFTAVAEALFWNEFSSRFNFIAVDYLIYTRETVGNIRQSYPVVPLLSAVAMLALLLFWVIRRPVWAAGIAAGGTPLRRLQASGLVVLVPVLSFLALDDAPREALPTPSMRELAGNGYYEFARALRNNDLDYNAFYLTIPEPEARRTVREAFAQAGSTAVFTGGDHPLERKVIAAGAPRPMHVVLVSIESLGAEFVASLGGKAGLTPNLNRLAREGLNFTQVYATGTRTVRGLEALTLSIPPTPGHAVPVRKNNKGFQTLGGVLKEQGYEPIYLYGGYSYFDNMSDFFGGNGYTVIDRGSLARDEISHETIWGVADEDLFKLTVREIDARAAAGRKVFAHVMTTSNHRPFTYPSGRIDIPSGSGRDGAVKYSDWAIGELMRQVSTRSWYKDTLFVFVADHTSRARGNTDLPPDRYHIPLIFYAPNVLAARTIDAVASQIDVGPTMLALLNVSYTSRFFGQDILTEGQHHQRALMANYLTVGQMQDGIVVELSPKRRARVLDAATRRELPVSDLRWTTAVNQAIAPYQVATSLLRAGRGAAPASNDPDKLQVWNR
jgi:glucan phosphoethanolaminetransferase (alkaline phosphatase superfamily)